MGNLYDDFDSFMSSKSGSLGGNDFSDFDAFMDEKKKQRELALANLGSGLKSAGALGGLDPSFVKAESLDEGRAMPELDTPGFLERKKLSNAAGLLGAGSALAKGAEFAATRLDDVPFGPGWVAEKILNPFLSDEQKAKRQEQEAKYDEMIGGPLNRFSDRSEETAAFIRPEKRDILDKVVEAAPTTLAIAGASALGPETAAPVIGGALGGLITAGDTAHELESRGVSRDQATRLGSLVGAVAAPLEGIGNSRLAGALTGRLEGRLLPSVAKTALTEGTTEALQELPQIGAEVLTGKDMTLKDAWGRVKEAGIIGGLTGAGIHAGSHVVQPVVSAANRLPGMVQESRKMGDLFDGAFESGFEDAMARASKGKSEEIVAPDFAPALEADARREELKSWLAGQEPTPTNRFNIKKNRKVYAESVHALLDEHGYQDEQIGPMGQMDYAQATALQARANELSNDISLNPPQAEGDARVSEINRLGEVLRLNSEAEQFAAAPKPPVPAVVTVPTPMGDVTQTVDNRTPVQAVADVVVDKPAPQPTPEVPALPALVAEGTRRIHELASTPVIDQPLTGFSPREISMARVALDPTLNVQDLSIERVRAVARTAFGLESAETKLLVELGFKIPTSDPSGKRSLNIAGAEGGAIGAVNDVVVRGRQVVEGFGKGDLVQVAKALASPADSTVLDSLMGVPRSQWGPEQNTRFAELLDQYVHGQTNPKAISTNVAFGKLVNRMHNALRVLDKAAQDGVSAAGVIDPSTVALFNNLATARSAAATGNKKLTKAVGAATAPPTQSTAVGAAPGTPSVAGPQTPAQLGHTLNPIDAYLKNPYDMAKTGDDIVKGLVPGAGNSIYSRWVDIQAAVHRAFKKAGDAVGSDMAVSIRNLAGIGADVVKNGATRIDPKTGERVRISEGMEAIAAGKSEQWERDLNRLMAADKQLELESVLSDHEMSLYRAKQDLAQLMGLKEINSKKKEVEFLEAKVAEQRAAINPVNSNAVRDGLREMRFRLGNEEMAKLRSDAERVRDWAHKAIVLKLVEVGRITQGEADAIMSKNQLWAPFHRPWYKDFQSELNQTDGSVTLHERTHDLGGALDEHGLFEGITDPLTAIINQVQRVTMFAEKQHVRNRVLSASDAFSDVIHDIVRIDPKTRRPTRKINFIAKKGESQIFRWENGEPVEYHVSPDVYRALGRLSVSESNLGAQLMQRVAHGLRVGATLTPRFISRNPVRDQPSAALGSRHGFLPVADFMRGLFASLPQEIAGGSKIWQAQQEVLKTLEMNGSEMGSYTGKSDLIAAATSMVDMRTGGQSTEVWNKIKKSWRENVVHPPASKRGLGKRAGGAILATIDTAMAPFEFAASVSEQATRRGAGLNAMAQMKKRGEVSPLKAVREMREQAGVDFDKWGSQGRVLNSYAAFFNVAIQDSVRMAQAIKASPAGFTLKALTLMTLPALYNWWKNHDDEDYKNLQQYEQDMFLHFKNDDGSFTKIPRPIGIANAVFGTGVEMVAKYLEGHDPVVMREWASRIFQQSAPNPIPTAAQVASGVVANKDWFRDGRAIDDMGDMQSSMQFRGEDQGPTVKAMSRAITAPMEAAGIDQSAPWLYDMASPNRVAYAAEGVGAGTAKALLGASDKVIAGQTGTLQQPESLADFLGFHSKKPTGFRSKAVSDFRKLQTQAKMMRRDYNRLKDSSNTDALAVQTGRMKADAFYTMMNNTEQHLSQFRDEQEKVFESLPPGLERNQALKAINDKIDLWVSSTLIEAREKYGVHAE